MNLPFTTRGATVKRIYLHSDLTLSRLDSRQLFSTEKMVKRVGSGLCCQARAVAYPYRAVPRLVTYSFTLNETLPCDQ